MFIHESGSLGRPTIVLLHGNGTNGSMWKRHMAQLENFHCLAPDFPGFGQSGNLEWISLDATTDEVIKLVQERTPQTRVHIVGLSLGGSVAMTWLGTAPHLVDHAIVDGAGVQPLPVLPFIKVGLRLIQPFMHTDFIIGIIARMTKIPAEEYKEFKQGMLAMSPSSFTRSFVQANSMRLPPRLEEVTCRVLFVAGEREPKVVRQSQASLARLLANADSYIAPGMGHGWLAEAPDLHLRMIQAWMQDEAMPEPLVRVS
jgi:pimeloyl-ACP methyl ester carboxylesterase